MNDWMERCHKYTFVDGKSGFQINFAGMKFEDSAIKEMAVRFESVHAEMQKIEKGEIKNPDENRKVTHFTDRSVYTGSAEFQAVEEFTQAIRTGAVKGSTGKKFEAAYINGIGGSALGPQLLQMAVNGPYWNEKSDAARKGNLKIYFLDNTDTAGLADALEVTDLETTLVINISKSGGTQETKNNMKACMDKYAAAGLDFAKWLNPSADAPAKPVLSDTFPQLSPESTSKHCWTAHATWMLSPEIRRSPKTRLTCSPQSGTLPETEKATVTWSSFPIPTDSFSYPAIFSSWSWKVSVRKKISTETRFIRA